MTKSRFSKRFIVRCVQLLCLLACFGVQLWADDGGSRCNDCDGCNGDFYCGLCIVEAVQRNCKTWGPGAYATCNGGIWEVHCEPLADGSPLP